MRSKTIRRLVGTVAFCFIFYLLLYISSLVFMPRVKEKETCIGNFNTNGYRAEIEDSIDVLLIGNSNVYCAFSPIEFWKKYNVTSYVSGKAFQSPSGAYKVLKDSLKYQNPKLVAIEMDCFFTGMLSGIKAPKNVKTSLSSMKNKVNNSLQNLNEGLGTAIGYWLPTVKYHDRWKKINKKELLNIKDIWHFSGKGYIISNKRQPYNGGFSYMGKRTNDVDKMPSSKKKYLEKMIDLCQKRNIKVVLFSVPSATTWNYKRHNAVNQFAKEHNLNYVDLNVNSKQINFDWKKDTRDAGKHLNYFGAEKVTNYFGTYIINKYSLKPVKDEAIYHHWKLDSQNYYKLLEKSA